MGNKTGVNCLCLGKDKKANPQTLCDLNNIINKQQIKPPSNSMKPQPIIPKKLSIKFSHHKLFISAIKSMQITQIGELAYQYILKSLQPYLDFDDIQKLQTSIIETLQLIRDEVINQYDLVNAFVQTIDRVKQIKKIINQQQRQSSLLQIPYRIHLYKSTYQLFNQTFSSILAQLALNHLYLTNLWKQQGYHCKCIIKRKMTEEQKKYFLNQQQIQCQICLTQIEKSFKAPLLNCNHIFHIDCIRNHIKTNLDNNIIHIRCPVQQCENYLTVNDLQTFLDNDLMDKYYKFQLNKYVEDNKDKISWCPTAGCSAVFQYDQSLTNYQCPVCTKHYCLKCRTDYHNGMTCQQFKMSINQKKNDEKFLSFVKGAKFKQCPSCKYWVERTSGCPSIKCRCGIRFCYKCGGTQCPNGSCKN